MKIAFAISNFDSEDSNAEMTALYLDWARIPQLKGHEVVLYTLSEIGESVKVVDGVRIHHLPFDPALYRELTEFTFAPVLSWFLPRSIELYRQSRKAFADFKPDIVHCIKPLDSLLWSSQGEYPVVIQSVSPQFELMRLDFEKQYGAFDTSAVQALESLGYACANAITVPSHTLLKVISEGTGLPPERFTIIRAPINIDTGTKRVAPQETVAYPRILHAAGVEKLKGVDDLIEALKTVVQKYPRAKLSIAGEEPATIGGPTSFADKVKQMVAKLELANNVEFLGIRPRQEIHQRLRESDIFVFPLLYCGCPYACMEAMASATPIVATNAGAIAEYVDDGESGILIEPNSAESLANAILRLVDDRGLASSMGFAAQKKAAEMCSPAKLAESTEALYAEAIAAFNRRSKENISATKNAVKHGLDAFDNLCTTPYLKQLFEAKFREGADSSFDEMHSPKIAFKRAGIAGSLAALALKAGSWSRED